MRFVRRFRFVAALGALVALGLAGGWLLAPPGVGHATHGGDHAGFFKIATVSALAPNASASGWWNNTPDVYRTFIDVMPFVPLPPPEFAQVAAETYPCKMEVTREYKERYLLNGNPAVRLHWTVKNVGTTTCSVDVFYGWVRNNPVVIFP
jgi:hypothetical protein